jgi:hypothetical protein
MYCRVRLDTVRFLQSGARDPYRAVPDHISIRLPREGTVPRESRTRGLRMDAGLRGRVGLLCEQLSRWPSLRTIIGDAGAHTELADLLAVLAHPREPEADRVRTLLDAIEKACVGVGLTGLTSRTKAPDAGLTLPHGVNAVPGLVG